jgi:DNA-binding transcriptional MerR regulator
MASEKTLREVCEDLDVTRRVIQGYELAGLVKATGKNKYGHLLYDKETQETIARIRFYQKMGFTIKEIKILMMASKDDVICMIKKQIEHLAEERKELEKIIKQAERLIQQLSS